SVSRSDVLALSTVACAVAMIDLLGVRPKLALRWSPCKTPVCVSRWRDPVTALTACAAEAVWCTNGSSRSMPDWLAGRAFALADHPQLLAEVLGHRRQLPDRGSQA